MRVKQVNEFMYWTWYGRYDVPVLVVLESAPEEQIHFAKEFEKFASRVCSTPIAKVMFEKDVQTAYRKHSNEVIPDIDEPNT